MSVTTDSNDTKTDTPPRRRRRTSPTATAGSASGMGEAPGSSPEPPRPGSTTGRNLQKKLEEFFGALALPYATVGDEYAASLIAERAPKLAEAWADLAKQNKGVERFLNGLLQGTAWGSVIISSASLAVPLLAHHGIIPVPIDPFAAMYPGASPQVPVRGQGPARMPQWNTASPGRGPIIPDPPTGDENYMTPPQTEGEPPGVFTVAGSNNGAVQVAE